MRSVKKFFDDYAAPFSKISGSISGYYNKEEFSSLITRFLRNSMSKRYFYTIDNIARSESSSLLDIGCGPGDYSLALRERGICNTLAIDFSKKMVELARSTEIKRFGDSLITWTVGDYLDINIEKKYDASIVVGVMDYIENPENFVKKVIGDTDKISIISFPKKFHILSIQRKIRYKNKCYLRFYSRKQLQKLFSRFNENYEIQIHNFGRDYIVRIQK